MDDEIDRNQRKSQSKDSLRVIIIKNCVFLLSNKKLFKIIS